MTTTLEQPPAAAVGPDVGRRCRVLFVVPHLDGSMRLLADYLRHLDPSFEVTLFSYEPNVRFRAEFPAEARTIICRHGLSARHLPATFARLLRETWRADLVCAWAELSPSYVATAAAMLCGKPVVGWVHAHLSRVFNLGQRPGRLHRPVLKFFYRRMAAVAGVSQLVADDLRDAYGIASARAISNGVDLDRIRRLSREPLPDRLRGVFDAGEPVVVSVAALAYQKHPELAIRAHARLRAAGVRHRLLMVGHGPLYDEVRKLIDELGVGESVTLAGYVDNPYPMMRHASVFLLNSRWEGLPLVLPEALACDLPVVCTDSPGGSAELLHHGRYGLLVPVDDEDALVEALRKALTEEPTRRQLISRAPEGAEHASILPRVREMERIFRAAMRGRL